MSHSVFVTRTPHAGPEGPEGEETRRPFLFGSISMIRSSWSNVDAAPLGDRHSVQSPGRRRFWVECDVALVRVSTNAQLSSRLKQNGYWEFLDRMGRWQFSELSASSSVIMLLMMELGVSFDSFAGI